MAEQNNLGAGADIGNVSWTAESSGDELRTELKRWLPKFKENIHSMPKATEAWDTLLKKGCDAQDLEWAFFWAVDVQKTLTHVPQILKKFHEQSADLVRRTSKLWPSLKKLMDLRVLEKPVWYVYCQFFSFTEKEVWRFFRFPADLVSFQTKLRLFGANKKLSWSYRKSPPAIPGELPSLYINVCTRRPHYGETSLLLSLAAEASRFVPDEKEDPFTLEAIQTAYKRLRREHRKQFKEIEGDIRELSAKRKTSSGRLDLIPFLVARKQAREKPSIDYVKGLYSKPRIPS